MISIMWKVKMNKILIPIKIPLWLFRELLILILKYGYNCRVDVPDGKNKREMNFIDVDNE